MRLPDFSNNELLLTALTHRSALNEPTRRGKQSNERLEYLGDAVLELVVTEFLYQQLPSEPEGVLTAVRSGLVKTTTLASVSRELSLGEKIYLSHGEQKAGGHLSDTLLADTFEAVVGALYLDQGFVAAKEFIAQTVLIHFSEIYQSESYRDAKSKLQEEVQAMGLPTPVYQLEKETGPDHDKNFAVAVYLQDEKFGIGEGKNKQLAQQQAAAVALEKFRQRQACLGTAVQSEKI